MVFCPLDLAPCCRNTCGTGVCERLGEVAMVACWECGEMLDRSGATFVCAACARVYCATAGKEP